MWLSHLPQSLALPVCAQEQISVRTRSGLQGQMVPRFEAPQADKMEVRVSAVCWGVRILSSLDSPQGDANRKSHLEYHHLEKATGLCQWGIRGIWRPRFRKQVSSYSGAERRGYNPAEVLWQSVFLVLVPFRLFVRTTGATSKPHCERAEWRAVTR